MNRASWSASVCVLLLIAGKAGAMPLDPRDFPSLGAMSISSGAFNSDGTPILITGGMTYTGTVSQGVAVFSFDSLTLGSVSIFGSRPIALLSRGNLIAGNLSVSGLGGAGGQGGQSLNSISGSPGLGTGGGSGATPVGGGGGGGFGGAGGQGGSSLGDSAGGPAYGNLLVALEPGSGGGGGTYSTFLRIPGQAGSSGGGTIELGALGQVQLSGLISADGIDVPPTTPSYPGGGGSGGGILVHGASVDLSGILSAQGGDGGSSSNRSLGGGGGGGGRIVIVTNPGGFTNEGSIVVSGGLGGTGVSGNRAGSGAVGQFSLVTVPEPSALALSVLGGLTLSLIAGATRRVRSLRRSRNGTGTDRR